MRTKPVLYVCLFVVLAFGAALYALSQAAELRLEWDYLPEGAEGITVHTGPQSGMYDRTFDVGATTETVITSPALRGRLWVALTAYNSAGESGFSGEVAADCPEDDGDCVPVWRFVEVQRITYECRPAEPCTRVRSSTTRRATPVLD